LIEQQLKRIEKGGIGMNIKNISKQIHVVMTRQLYNSIAVNPKRSSGFLQAFEPLNHIVQVIECCVRKAVRDFIKTVLNFKSLPSDLAQAKMSKIISVVKKSLQRSVS
jgi:hypothetical protein